MSASAPLISARYGEALLWAEAIHRDQRRKGKAVPYIARLISVSALVWEDGGTEEQAIAALLHDAIEDAGQSHGSIAERFGDVVTDIVRDCTDTSDNAPTGEKEPWLLRKTRYIASLEHKPEASLLVTAADKAHNAGDMVQGARRDPVATDRDQTEPDRGFQPGTQSRWLRRQLHRSAWPDWGLMWRQPWPVLIRDQFSRACTFLRRPLPAVVMTVAEFLKDFSH